MMPRSSSRPACCPADGRFGCGPSKIRPEQLAALAGPGAACSAPRTGRRRSAALVQRIREGLAELFGLPDGYLVVLGNGGTTAFWEIAAFGLVDHRAQHLSFGEFSAKFAKVTAAAPWLDDAVGHRRRRPAPTRSRGPRPASTPTR